MTSKLERNSETHPAIPRTWEDLDRIVKATGDQTILKAISPLQAQMRRDQIMPQNLNETAYARLTVTLAERGRKNAASVTNSACKAMVTLIEKHGVVLPRPPLANTPATRRDAAWAAVDPHLRQEVELYLPRMTTENARRLRSAVGTIVPALQAEGVVATSVTTLLAPATLDAIVDSKLLAKLGKQRGKMLGDLHSLRRLQTLVLDRTGPNEVTKVIGGLEPAVCEVDRAKTLEMAPLATPEGFAKLVIGFSGGVFDFAAAPLTILNANNREVLTRKSLLPAAEDGLAAILMLATRLGPTALAAYRFEGPTRHGVCGPRSTLVDPGARAEALAAAATEPDPIRRTALQEDAARTREDRLAEDTRALLDVFHAAFLRHLDRAPESLFDKVVAAKGQRDVSNIGKGIKHLGYKMGLELSPQILLDLFAYRLLTPCAGSGAAPVKMLPVGEVAHASNYTLTQNFRRRFGPWIDADCAAVLVEGDQ